MSTKLQKHIDTGWKNGTLSSGVTGELKYRFKNGIVYVVFNLSYNHQNFFDKLGTIPYKYSNELSFIARSDSRGPTTCLLNSAGELMTAQGGGDLTSFQVIGTFSFIPV